MTYKHISAALLLGSVLSFSRVSAQAESDSTGLPGDNFSLQGALELFKQSKTPEELEKKLNDASNKVNNLDLNNDGTVDYVRVIDKKDKDAHAIILQVPVSSEENQDVAVIELEKTGDKEAIVQIVGDEDLYGEKKIVEPQEPEEASNFMSDETLASGPNAAGNFSNSSFITINVWGWPFVQYVYAPDYIVWESPWGWYDRPVWYRPWRPYSWSIFWGGPRYYYHNYAYVNMHRTIRCQQIYRPIRRTSVYVRTRNTVVINRYRSSRQSNSYNRANNGRGDRNNVRGYDNRGYNNNGNNNRVNRNRTYNNNRSGDARVNPGRIENNNGASRNRVYRPGNENSNTDRFDRRADRQQRPLNNVNGNNRTYRERPARVAPRNDGNFNRPIQRQPEARANNRVQRSESRQQNVASPRGGRPSR